MCLHEFDTDLQVNLEGFGELGNHLKRIQVWDVPGSSTFTLISDRSDASVCGQEQHLSPERDLIFLSVFSMGVKVNVGSPAVLV